MINHPVLFHRDVSKDFNLPKVKKEFWDKCQSVAMAALPLLALHDPFRGPLTVGLSVVRMGTHTQQMVASFKQRRFDEGAWHLFHTSMAVASIALVFFNPVLGFITSSVSDFVSNSRALVEHVKAGNHKEALVALASMTLDALFIFSICYGSIEMTVGCLLLQIVLDLHFAMEHFRKGEYIEGLCRALLGCAHLHQAIPQIELWQWSRTHGDFYAELKQDERGFVYLDIPDEYVYSLEKLYHKHGMELPPYFGKDKAGAHVSVIAANDGKGLKVAEVGKKYKFRVVNVDSVKPDGWAGVDKVHFLTLDCPALESLRSKYGFTPKMNGHHDFHLTFGLEKAASAA